MGKKQSANVATRALGWVTGEVKKQSANVAGMTLILVKELTAKKKFSKKLHAS